MILVGNGKLITHNDELPYIENGCIAIEDNIIKEFGDTEVIKAKYKGYEFIDADGKVIMPGLINTHHHIYSAFARGLTLNNKPLAKFTDILKNVWWRIDKKLLLDDVIYSGYVTFIECIENGVTTVFDHHASPYSVNGSLFSLAEVAKKVGIRGSLCYEVSDRDGGEIFKQGIKENEDFIKYTQKLNNNMIKAMVGMHASFTLSNNSLLKCAEISINNGVGCHIHVAEGIEDVQDSLKKYGKRVVERLMDNNILGENTLAVHCIHVNNNELDILQSTNTAIVNNPQSNMGNSVGCAPVIKMIEKGLKVGIGTDGYTSDIFESMKVENIVHKDNLCDSNVGFNETGIMAFKNNRDIASRYFNNDIGIIKNGAYADIIIVDYNPYTKMDSSNLLGHIIFGFSGKAVFTTIINGKVIMKNRILALVDKETIFSKSIEVSQKLWSRL